MKNTRHHRRDPLTIEQVLAWADAYFPRVGGWPQEGGLPVSPVIRRRRKVKTLRPLTDALILGWADAHFRRIGRWPHVRAGLIPRSGGETWATMDEALRWGHRGLPGGSSLKQLLRDRGRGE